MPLFPFWCRQILGEIGRGQHGTVRLGKDMSITPDRSRAGTASSSASALVSRQPSASSVLPSRQPSAGPSYTALNELTASPVIDENGRKSEDASSPVSAQMHLAHSHGYQSLLAQAVAAKQASEEADSPPDTVAGQCGGVEGSFWAIKIVDRQPRRKLPGVQAVRESFAQGGHGAQGAPTRGVGSTGEK
jgi:hypothetical protein